MWGAGLDFRLDFIFWPQKSETELFISWRSKFEFLFKNYKNFQTKMNTLSWSRSTTRSWTRLVRLRWNFLQKYIFEINFLFKIYYPKSFKILDQVLCKIFLRKRSHVSREIFRMVFDVSLQTRQTHPTYTRAIVFGFQNVFQFYRWRFSGHVRFLKKEDAPLVKFYLGIRIADGNLERRFFENFSFGTFFKSLSGFETAFWETPFVRPGLNQQDSIVFVQ